MKELTQDVIDNLSPGIRGAVLWLRQRGWETTDSGDGTNYKEGMGCAPPCPMVSIKYCGDRYDLVSMANILHNRLIGF